MPYSTHCSPKTFVSISLSDRRKTIQAPGYNNLRPWRSLQILICWPLYSVIRKYNTLKRKYIPIRPHFLIRNALASQCQLIYTLLHDLIYSLTLWLICGQKRYEQNCQSSESKPSLLEVCRVVMAFDKVNCQMALRMVTILFTAQPINNRKFTPTGQRLCELYQNLWKSRTARAEPCSHELCRAPWISTKSNRRFLRFQIKAPM